MATSVSASIQARGVTCGYGVKQVVGDVSLEIAAGHVTALIGPNGSGKSTLMKTLAGAIPPLSGSVVLCEEDISTLNKREIARRIGYVPQTESPVFDFTVREVVLMGRIPHSDGLFESKQDHEAAQRAMELADCLPIADRPMSQLSGGEAQRARIARALAQEAPILLMDEPTTHLDVKHQMDIGRLSSDFAQKGMAIAVAVHDLNWASAFCQRTVLLCNGRVIESGPTEHVLQSERLDQAFECNFVRLSHGRLMLLADFEKS